MVSTPAIVIDAEIVRRNVLRMADYARAHGLALRPHTKTHKQKRLAEMQMQHGATGLTVAKSGEAEIMAALTPDLLSAYPPADAARAAVLARLGRQTRLQVSLDSEYAIGLLCEAARAANAEIGVLIDVDVGMGRTGVGSKEEALFLARTVDASRGLRLDGLFFYPGQVGGTPDAQVPVLQAIDRRMAAVADLWKANGLKVGLVSGGSTPTARQSHHMSVLTEIRPGTYVFNDMNCVRAGVARIEDCAARVLTTVVSTAVTDQVVVDAGSKTLSSDRCGPAPDSGHGHVLEYPQAKIVYLNEEHGRVDVSLCSPGPKLGEVLTVIPNHICTCINMHDSVWWQEPGQEKERVPIDARGRVI